MEESNQDEIIGGTGVVDDEVDKKKEEEEEPVVVEAPKPIAKRIEILDCNSMNGLIFHFFNQGDFNECKSIIGEVLTKFKNRNEFALHLRGVIARMEGQLPEALEWFTKAFEQSGKNPKYYYDIGRVNFLLGKHVLAYEQLSKAHQASNENPKIVYWMVRCLYHFRNLSKDGKTYDPISVSRDVLMRFTHTATDVTLTSFLGKLLEELNDVNGAILAYKKALELQSDNVDVMLRLGLLFLRSGNAGDAVSHLGQCLVTEPSNSDAILALGAILQQHSDHDVALNKYRIASDVCDYNGCLWNNIGVGLMARDKLAAAHSALKKAAFINPLNYKISYNLGVLHEAMSLNCSALHYMKLASELSPNNPKIIGALGVILSHMKDEKNTRIAYLRAIELGAPASVLLNYAIFEYHEKNMEEAWKALVTFRKMQQTEKKISADLISTAELLERVLVTSADKKPIGTEGPEQPEPEQQ